MQKRIFIILGGIVLVLALMAGSAAGGFIGGSLYNSKTSGVYAPFWQAWDAIHQDYVDQPVDDTLLIRGAIDGMMQSLGDEHTAYMEPQTYQNANAVILGYEGIGAVVDASGTFLKIIAPYPGTPADQAGLKPGDEIIRIDGEDMTGISPETARQKVLGPAGSHVQLTVRREGVADPITVDVVRAKIIPPSVESRMLPDGIAYIRIYTFADDTGRQVQSALKELLAQNPKGLVLDLRGDPGGLVTAAIAVASQFLPEDKLVFTEKRSGGISNPMNTVSGGLALEIPMAVLVDKGSASASEIVAGALQDYGRAKLVGAVTYGKGTEQYWIPLVNNQGAIRITVARWYTPNGRQISQQGLSPDYPVTLSEADFQAGRDPQLAKAVAILLQTEE